MAEKPVDFAHSEYYSRPDGTGMIKISEDVVASIATVAAQEIRGIEPLAGGIGAEIASVFGVKLPPRGVKVAFAGDSVTIDMYVTVRYGYTIPDMAKKLQDNISNSVESMTGLEVAAVNIKVVTVNFDNGRAPQKQDAAAKQEK